MIAHRFLPASFFLLIFAAAPAWAQAPPVANAPVPGADFLRADGGDPVPDTTAPWRYFPLHVGDAWEYYNYATGGRRRVDVLGEETHNGQHYFTWRSRTYDANGNSADSWGPRPVRFDTTQAIAVAYFTNTDNESPLIWSRCPLDASFGDEVECAYSEAPFEVGGGYDGMLVFGGEFPGTGEDTVRTAAKTYYSYHPGHTLDYRYAADIGFVYYDDKYDREGIYYAKVDGVEYGQPFYPVSSEDGAPEMEALTLSAYPNPFRSQLTVVMNGATGGLAEIELIDMLGRTVHRERLGWGEHTLDLSGEELVPGAYLVRIRAGTGGIVTKKVLKL